MKPGTRIETVEDLVLPNGQTVKRGNTGWVVREPTPDCFSGILPPHAVTFDGFEGLYSTNSIREA